MTFGRDDTHGVGGNFEVYAEAITYVACEGMSSEVGSVLYYGERQKSFGGVWFVGWDIEGFEE